MPISRKRKEELVARYVELLKESQGIIITHAHEDHFGNHALLAERFGVALTTGAGGGDGDVLSF